MSKRKLIAGLSALIIVLILALVLRTSPSGDKAAGPESAGPAGEAAPQAAGQAKAAGPASSSSAATSSQTAASAAVPLSPADLAKIPWGPKAQRAFELALALREVRGGMANYHRIINEIVALGPEGLPGLAAYLRMAPPMGDISLIKRDYNARIGLMNIMGEIGDPAALPVLAEILESAEQPSSINTAGRNIGRIGGAEAYSVLLSALAASAARPDAQGEVRETAIVMGMGLAGAPQGIPLLKDVMEDPSKPEKTRIYAAGCLGMLGDSSGLDLAIESLNSDDYLISIPGARALAEIADPSSIEVLEARYENADNLLLKEAIKMALFQVETAQKPDDEKADFIKERLMEHPANSPYVQWGTMALDRMDTPAAQKALEEMAALTDPKFELLSWTAKIRIQGS